MKTTGGSIKHPKRRGEWAEICFLKRAAEFGLEVSKPWGDTASYDFIVEKAQHTSRVQVKSTIHRRKTAYVCKIRNYGNRCYAGNPFDFVAAYLILEDMWYIIPARYIVGKTSIEFFPGRRRSKYDSFREAWHFLLPPESSRKSSISIQACVEPEIGFPLPIRHSQGQRLLAGI